MGKKKKSLKKQLKPFINDNKVLLAAIGGIATGISIAGILGTDKARQIVSTIEDSIKDFSNKVKNTLPGDETSQDEVRPKRKAHGVENENVSV